MASRKSYGLSSSIGVATERFVAASPKKKIAWSRLRPPTYKNCKHSVHTALIQLWVNDMLAQLLHPLPALLPREVLVNHVLHIFEQYLHSGMGKGGGAVSVIISGEPLSSVASRTISSGRV